MKITNENRRLVNIAAANFLTEQDDGDLCDAYSKLIDAKNFGDGEQLASDFVNVPEIYEYQRVNDIVNLIEAAMVSIKSIIPVIPEFIAVIA